MKKLAILLISILPINAFAVDELLYNYRSARSTAMGGLLTTTSEFGESLFSNPARHSLIEKKKFVPIDWTFSINDNLIGDTGKLSDLIGEAGVGAISKASSLVGKNEHFRFQWLMGYYNPHIYNDLAFSGGLLIAAHSNVSIRYTTDIDMQGALDVGPAFGFSHPFLDKKLSLGVNIRGIYRAGTDQLISVLSLLQGKSLAFRDLAQQGVGVDADLGAYYEVPWKPSFLPEGSKVSVGTSLNNLVQSHYSEFDANIVKSLGKRPPANDRLGSAGVRVDVEKIWIAEKPLFALEVQDIGNTTKRYSLFKRLHAGTEARFWRHWLPRLGLNQGYISGGIGFDSGIFNFDVSTYGQEIAGTVGESEDRRFMLRLALEF